MEIEGEKPSSLPSNYVTIHQLKEKWLLQQQQKQSPSKPEPQNPNAKPKTKTQNQRPNYDNGSTSKTLVVNETKNPNKNDAIKPQVDDDGSTLKTLVVDDMKNLKIKPMTDDDVGVTDDKFNGENETDHSNFDTKKKRKKKINKRFRHRKVVTDQNAAGVEREPGAKVVEEKWEKRSYPSEKKEEVEMVEGKGKEGRIYGRGDGKGNSRFGDEPERKMEPGQEVEVVEEKMEKKSYACRKPADKNLNGDEKAEVEVENRKWGHTYGRRNGNSRVVWEQKEKTALADGNGGGGGVFEEVVKERNTGQGRDSNEGYGNSRFGAEPEGKMESEQEAEVVEEKMEKKSFGRRRPADKNPNGAELTPEREEEVVVEKGKQVHRNGRRGDSRVVWEQKEKTEPVDGNGGGGGGGGDGVVEKVVKERIVGQGRDRNEGYGNGNSRFGAEPEGKMEAEQEAEVVEKKSYGRQKPADKNPNGAELTLEMEEEVVVEKGKWGLRYGRRNANSKVVWEQKEKTAPVCGNGGGGDGVVEEVVKEMNVGQGRDKNEDYGRDKIGDYRRDRKGARGRDRNGGSGRDRNGGHRSFQNRVPRGSSGEQKGQIWVKKGESVVPN